MLGFHLYKTQGEPITANLQLPPCRTEPPSKPLFRAEEEEEKEEKKVK